MDYPEHEKLRKVSEDSQRIGAFLDWLQNEEEIVLAEYASRSDHLSPVHRSVQEWLARYYEIDLKKLDDEKRAMLEELRAMQEPRP